jgi:hypothetical protein
MVNDRFQTRNRSFSRSDSLSASSFEIWVGTRQMAPERYSRRTLLKLSGAVVATMLLDVTRWPVTAAAQEAVRSEWTFESGLPASGEFTTPVLRPDSAFDAVDLNWLSSSPESPGLRFELRTQYKNGDWSEWTVLERDGHSLDEHAARGYVAPLMRDGVAVQVRVFIENGADIRDFRVGTLDTSSAADPVAQSAVPSPIDGFIIPRAGWGADEKLRHINQDPSKPIHWTPQYRPIEKIIIHHTVTENNPVDVAASLRSIYYYHAVTRGWGDIGYNFVVDWNGNVYEGRFGGPNVVGGHALQYNPGSIGIALLGNFSSVSPPQVMIDAVVRLIKTRASHVDVTTASDFVDLIALANLCGHGDVLATSCPGDSGRPVLPILRGRVAGTGPIEIASPVKKEWLELVSCEIGPATVYQENLLEVRMKVRNPSVTTIVSSAPEPGFVYQEGQTFDSAGFPKVQDTYRFGIDFVGNKGVPNPYRWGFGAPIKPGEVREVVGYVRVKDVASRTYSASIVKEFVYYLTENRFPQSVATSQPPVSRRQDLKLAGGQYFEITGHNVPRVFNEFWQARGGLRRFGYPLTEAFEEVSETDGGRYLTQYFERARFEWHPQHAGTQFEVQLGLLGSELEASRREEPAFKRIAPFTSTDERWFMPETGHSLSGLFKQVWIARGGLPIFGYPISEEFPELSATDGNWHMVQYFERNRFEHHLDYAGTYDEVMLGHLGREVLIRRGWMQRPVSV